MLTAHEDFRKNGNVRALVHRAGHILDDECWIIEGVMEEDVLIGYTFMKSQVLNLRLLLLRLSIYALCIVTYILSIYALCIVTYIIFIFYIMSLF